MNRYTTRPDLLKMTQKCHEGTATEAEKTFVDRYYAFFDQKYKDEVQLDAAAQKSIQNEMEAWLLDYISKPNEVVKEKPVRTLWPRIVVAAAAVAAITLGVWLYYASSINGRHPELVSGFPLANDIAPGKNTATLTLASGKVINLSDAKSGIVVGDEKLAYNDGSLVQDSSGSHFSGSLKGDQKNTGPVRMPSLGAKALLTASTPRGGTYQVTLPDGTRVWLNADSKISFPSQFSGGIRKILLSGEAYFEVNKDKARPFIVVTDRQTVEVLGTHFNINAYRDENNTRTTLLEGSLRVNGKSTAQGPVLPLGEGNIILKPGQQSILSNTNQILVKVMNAGETVAWRNGKFVFRKDDMQSVMRQVSRWYDIEVVYLDDMSGKTIWGTVNKYANISAVLDMIELTGGVSFRIEGRKVFVGKK
jgi:transmembrane sensor